MKQSTKIMREIRYERTYIAEMDYELQTQYPQPNCMIWLYGDPITIRRYNEAIIEYNKLVAEWNNLVKPKDYMTQMERVTFLKTTKKYKYERN